MIQKAKPPKKAKPALVIKIEFTDAQANAIIDDIMAGFPEASRGSALRCTGWNYERRIFTFVDEEDGKKYVIKRPELLKALEKMYDHTLPVHQGWPRGCPRPPASAEPKAWDDWHSESDATSADAFAQLACLGKVIYG